MPDRVLAAAIAAATALAAGCVHAPLPLRSESPPAIAATRPATVAAQVRVQTAGGRLGRAERQAAIERVGDQGSAPLVQRHLAAMSRFGEVDLYAGNEARLLVDGPATFAAMFAAIERARRSIVLESYIIEDAAIAQRLAALLAAKRAEGVPVAVMFDAVGSIGTDQAYFDRLRSDGISVCAFNPLNPLKRHRYGDITHRDHRKILVVDRETGFTGGINISAVYSSGSSGSSGSAGAFRRGGASPAPEGGWRDTQIRLRGPAAAALDDLVHLAWAQQGCTDPLPPAAPPRVASAAPGTQLLRIVPTSPDDGANRIYELLLTAIDASERSVYLTMAYFAPGPDMLDALCDAAQRGVDVQLVLPSVNDFAPVLHAGRSYYERLLAAGVKVHELQDAVLHAKTGVIDGVVSTVGSSNMDWRSFASNSEVNAVVMGEDFGDAMTAVFRRDVAASAPIELAAWRERPLWQRATEALARAFERWW